MRRILVGLIRVYQMICSPFLGANCRFTPTCSHYAIAVIRKFGVVRGIGYASWRILRCHPFSRGGGDPVP